MTNVSWVPTESDNAIVQEETWLQGVLLSNLLFGIQTMLCIMAFMAILRKRVPQHRRMRNIVLVYVGVLFAITTAFQGLSLDWIQMGFITQRNYPGGPSAFLNDQYGLGVNLAANVLAVLTNWMMESLLVWRCHVVCSTGEHLWWLGVAIPLALLMGVFVTGSLFLHSVLHSSPPTPYVLAYGGSSLALNLTATGFIAARLLVHRHRVVSTLGRGHGHQYASIAAVVIESAAVYTGFLVVVIVTYALGSPATNLFQQVIAQVQTISSLLIILRVARGEGWSRSTDSEVVSAVVSSWNSRVQGRDAVVQLDVLRESGRGKERERERERESYHEGV